MQDFIIILIFLIIGLVLKRIPAFPNNTGNVLNLFVIYISFPALVLLKIPELVFSKKMLVPTFLPWVMLIFSWALILLLSRVLKWKREVTGCLLLVVPLGNTSFLGIPMVKAFFGEQAIPYALLYDQLGSFLALATYGSLILAIYGTGENRRDIKGITKQVVLFPPFIALILALIFKAFSYPPILVNLLRILASVLVPLIMIAVGYQLTLRLNTRFISQLSIGLIVKLIIAPLTAYFLCKAIGLEGKVVQVSVFEAGMPPMVTAGALAIMKNISPTLAAAFVGIGIVLSFATLPILYLVILGQ